MITHSATPEPGKTWWTLGAAAATVGAGGVGWTLAEVAGAAAAGGTVLLGAVAIRWAITQRGDRAPAAESHTDTKAPKAAPSHPEWATPKLAGFYKEDSYKSDTRTALADGGTKSGLFVGKAPRSRSGTDL